MEGQRRRQRRRTATGEGRREHTGASRHLYEQKGEERAAKVKRREASHAAYAQTFLSFSSTPRRARFLRRLLANSRITLTPNPSRIALIPRPFRECLAENDLNVGRDSTSEGTAISSSGGRGQGCFSLCGFPLGKQFYTSLSHLCDSGLLSSGQVFQVARRRLRSGLDLSFDDRNERSVCFQRIAYRVRAHVP